MAIEGPTDSASVAAIAAWKINAVRLPLNEQAWRQDTAGYKAAIAAYVTLLHSYGLYVILDLHWSAPGNYAATFQQGMADADHSTNFWANVALAYKNDPAVIFDLYNEPHIGPADSAIQDPFGEQAWTAWKSGTTLTKYYPTQASLFDGSAVSVNWQACGMQAMVNAIRGQGATQPILLSGLGYASKLGGWLAHKPIDPLNQLIAGVHVYDNSDHDTQAQVATVAASVPVIISELGEYDCSPNYALGWMNWADPLGVSYLAWSWYGDNAPCSLVSQVVTDWNGTPTAFGAGFKSHLGA